MERQVLASAQFFFPTPSATTISSASSLKRNHIKTQFLKANNNKNNTNEINEVSKNNHYFDLSINPTNSSNNHTTNTSFKSLHQSNLLKNKSTMNSNTTSSYKNPNESLQCYPYHTTTTTTQRKTPMLNNSITSNTSDCNSSVLGHAGSTKYNRPTVHYHDDYHLDDSFKLFYNQDLNFPFVITSDDPIRQKQVKNFVPYQHKTKINTNKTHVGQNKTNTSFKDSSSSFSSIGKSTYQQNRNFTNNKEQFDNSLIIDRLNKLNMPLNEDLNDFTLSNEPNFDSQSKNKKFYLDNDDSKLDLSLPNQHKSNTSNKISKFIRTFKKKLRITSTENISKSNSNINEHDLSIQSNSSYKSHTKSSSQKQTKQNRDIIGKLFKAYNRTFRKDLVTKIDSASSHSSLNSYNNKQQMSSTNISDSFPYQETTNKYRKSNKNDPNLFDYNMNLILSQVNDKFGRDSPLTRQTYDNNYYLNNKSNDIQVRLRDKQIQKPDSAENYSKYNGSKFTRSDESINKYSQIQNEILNDSVLIPSSASKNNDLTQSLSRSKSLNNTAQTPTSKKRVSFHEQVLKTDVESGNSELVPIFYEMKDKVQRISTQQSNNNDDQQKRQQQQKLNIPFRVDTTNRNQLNLSQNTNLLGPFYEIPIRINRVNLAPTEISYPLSNAGQYEMINFNTNQNYSAYDNFDTNKTKTTIEHI